LGISWLRAGVEMALLFPLFGFVEMVESVFEIFDLFCELNGFWGGVCGCMLVFGAL
jgi:hypothetical protein